VTRRYVRKKPAFSLHEERVLAALRRTEGRLVPLPDLIAAVYKGYDALPLHPDRMVRWALQRLRQAGHPIVNVVGEGYALSDGGARKLPVRCQAVLDRLTEACGEFVGLADLQAVVWPRQEDRPASVETAISAIVRRLRYAGCDIVAHKRAGYRLDAIIEGEPRPALRLAPDGTTEPWRL
jgi:biotin operon repressor